LASAACSAEAPVPSTSEPLARIEARPDTATSRMFAFDEGDVVETFPSVGGEFLIHYTRTVGANDVPPSDVDTSGVPDFVEQVAEVYDEVLAIYQGELGFRRPLSDEAIADNGGDGRFDVYLVDFAGQGDGAFRLDGCLEDEPERCVGFMVQENDFAGYGYPSTLVANRILGSHEFFHAVQAAYDSDQGSVLGEGTAVWATERFDPSLSDFEGFLDGYLQNPDRSLDVPLPGPVDPFSYGSAIFFQFLEERFGEGTVRSLWERLENGANGNPDPQWLLELEPLVVEEGAASFAAAFSEFATWNLYLGDHANPAESYDAGDGYPPLKMTAVTAPHSEELLRVFYASAQYYELQVAGRAAMTAALVAPESDPEATTGLTLLAAVDRAGAYVSVHTFADIAAGSETVDTSGADRLVIVIVNGATGGDSKRPHLCIGSADEVASCRAALGTTTSSGAGGGGDIPPEEEESCSCTLPGSTKRSPLALLLACLAATALVTRRSWP
jgi:hypothetical protein